ncbi:MAG: hypothetical protein ACLSDQ_06945 [Adlercreutzia equolifaciens]
MIAYSSVFKRVEKKYRIGMAERAAIEVAVEGAMAVDAYGRSRITSLYLDTPDRAIVARSIEKPLYRRSFACVPMARRPGRRWWPRSARVRWCARRAGCRFPMRRRRPGRLRGCRRRGRPSGCRRASAGRRD